MKTPMSQILLIALAIIFAAALTLTITLICISAMNDAADTIPRESERASTTEDEDDRTTEPPFGSLATEEPEETSDAEEESTRPPVSTAEPTVRTEAETEPPQPTGNGLSFASNGNGTCTLVGLGTCTDVCIVIPERSPAGDRVTSIAPRALYSCSFVTAIQIPASVSSIGELAFADCDNLVFISVNVKNPYYCDVDGVLYTADLYTLLAYPAMHSGSSISIGETTYRISEMAFYNCAYLSHVYYAGSADQWERIVIESKNHSLTAAAKTFDSGKK